MDYKYKSNKIVLQIDDSFDLEQTLTCGQCFRENKVSENEFEITAKGKFISITKCDNYFEIKNTTKEDFEDIWIDYFDFNTNYKQIEETLSNDPIMKIAIQHNSGIRILNQDIWECLISYIISANNRIPQIKKVIYNISQKYGEKIDDTKEIYAFPTPEKLANATLEDLRDCRTGFRNVYVLDAAQKVASGELDLEAIKRMPTDEAQKELMKVKGVGIKVADCVLLFSANKHDVFPTDVWIKRIMEHFFIGRQASIKEIHALAKNKFGDLSGYAQEYLFAYARSLPKSTFEEVK